MNEYLLEQIIDWDNNEYFSFNNSRKKEHKLYVRKKEYNNIFSEESEKSLEERF